MYNINSIHNAYIVHILLPLFMLYYIDIVKLFKFIYDL